MTRIALSNVVATVALVASLASGAADATVLFQSDASTGTSSRSAFSGILTRVEVADTVHLTNIAVDVDLNGNGNLDYYIFNSVTGALLFETGPGAYIDNGLTFKTSGSFDFDMLAGTTYAIGAIADVMSDQAYVVPGGKTMNGISSQGGNQNLYGSSFASPGFNGTISGTDGEIQLIETIGASVPEPTSFALVALAIGAAGAVRRKQAA